MNGRTASQCAQGTGKYFPAVDFATCVQALIRNRMNEVRMCVDRE